MILFPSLGLIGAWETTCEGGPPTWLYFVHMLLLLLIRAKLIEAQLLKKLDKSIVSLGFAQGALEHVDYFTDGIFLLFFRP